MQISTRIFVNTRSQSRTDDEPVLRLYIHTNQYTHNERKIAQTLKTSIELQIISSEEKNSRMPRVRTHIANNTAAETWILCGWFRHKMRGAYFHTFSSVAAYNRTHMRCYIINRQQRWYILVVKEHDRTQHQHAVCACTQARCVSRVSINQNLRNRAFCLLVVMNGYERKGPLCLTDSRVHADPYS